MPGADSIPPPPVPSSRHDERVTLDYGLGRYPQYQRPRRLTVLAVIGLIFGILGFVLNAMVIPTVVEWFPNARVIVSPPPPPRTPAAVQPPIDPDPTLAPLTGEVLGPSGLDAADRKLVLDYIRAQLTGRPYVPGDLNTLLQDVDMLLQERGRDVLGTQQHPLEPGEISESILLCTRKAEQGPRLKWGVLHVKTRTGEIRAEQNAAPFADQIDFTFDDGKKISISGMEMFGATYTDEDGAVHFASATLEKTVREMRNRMRNQPRAGIDAAAFVAEARKLDVSEFTGKGRPVDLHLAFTDLGQRRSTVEILMPNMSRWWIDPTGRILKNVQPGTDPDTLAWKPFAVARPFVPRGLTTFQMSLTVLELLIDMLLWGLLAAASRMVFSDKSLGRDLAIAYAWIAIGMAFARFGLLQWFGQEFSFHLSVSRPDAVTMLLTNLIVLFASFALPLAVLIVMNTRAVRQFYTLKQDEPTRL